MARLSQQFYSYFTFVLHGDGQPHSFSVRSKCYPPETENFRWNLCLVHHTVNSVLLFALQIQYNTWVLLWSIVFFKHQAHFRCKNMSLYAFSDGPLKHKCEMSQHTIHYCDHFSTPTTTSTSYKYLYFPWHSAVELKRRRSDKDRLLTSLNCTYFLHKTQFA